jgi:hypothetical protein
MDFDQTVEKYHLTLIEFARGNPKPVNALLSHEDDVSLAGGFGGFTQGYEKVAKNIEFAATQFREGQISFENLAKYATHDLGYIVEIDTYEPNWAEVKRWPRMFCALRASFGEKTEFGSLFIATATQQPL